jgi:hypothetical protein
MAVSRRASASTSCRPPGSWPSKSRFCPLAWPEVLQMTVSRDAWLIPSAWSPDGRWLVGTVVNTAGSAIAVGVYDVATEGALGDGRGLGVPGLRLVVRQSSKRLCGLRHPYDLAARRRDRPPESACHGPEAGLRPGHLARRSHLVRQHQPGAGRSLNDRPEGRALDVRVSDR